jgi:hypothetical protein
VFVRNEGPFERARALNVGSGLAESELVLWLDNDLLTGPHFLGRAVAELEERRLDYLIPYSSVRYLGEADSRRVLSGERSPADCQPTRVLYSNRRKAGCSGGAGLVTRAFLRRYGGLIEGFVGWGGEDNAWNRKVALLGRSAPTTHPEQAVHHLFHASSGGYPGRETAAARNPHYARNVALLARVCTIRDAARFLREFPPPTHASCPWDPARRIVLLELERQDGPLPGALRDALRGLYGCPVEEAVLSMRESWRERCERADAVLVFGTETARRLAAEGATAVLRKALVILGAGAEPASTSAAARLPLPTVRIPPSVDGDATRSPLAVAGPLVGPLSLVLAGIAPSEPGSLPAGADDRRSALVRDLPVWAYWEGPCPPWIEECRRTIAAHASNFRLLTPEAFEGLRDRDRDIDLSRLLPVQRADFVRAFLLARFGGLWIDSDCLVMQSLDPVLDRLGEHDFVAHRERSGLVSNGFIAARPGSRIAELFYRRVCRILRARAPLGWTTLGSQPLNAVLDGCGVPWLELPCERVQPICWSNPRAFLARGPRSQHEAAFDPRAYCYMLSNTEIGKLPGAAADLLDPATFFTFLVRQSLGAGAEAAGDPPPADAATDALPGIFAGFVAAYRRFGDESLSGPGSSLAQTAELRERLPQLLEDLGVRSLLDAPCGDFHWMSRVRLGLDDYVGVDLLPELVERNQRRHGRPRRRFACLDIRRDPLPEATAILSRDCLVHLPFEDAFRALRNFKRSQSRYLLATTFPGREENRDTSRGEWRPLNLERAPFHFPKPLRVVNERCSEAAGAYGDKSLAVWRLADVPV